MGSFPLRSGFFSLTFVKRAPATTHPPRLCRPASSSPSLLLLRFSSPVVPKIFTWRVLVAVIQRSTRLWLRVLISISFRADVPSTRLLSHLVRLDGSRLHRKAFDLVDLTSYPTHLQNLDPPSPSFSPINRPPPTLRSLLDSTRPFSLQRCFTSPPRFSLFFSQLCSPSPTPSTLHLLHSPSPLANTTARSRNFCTATRTGGRRSLVERSLIC